MASEFMASVIRTRIMPAAAAFCWNASSGRDVQLNIWIGITVKPELSHSKLMNGGAALTGEGGRNAMNVSAPMVMMGAVSPMARESPMMQPVRMPGFSHIFIFYL